MTPMDKAQVIDKHAHSLRNTLAVIAKADDLWEEVVTVARGRHVLGHYEYGDTNLFEWSDGKVQAASIEELADWLVYRSWLRERLERRNGA